MCVNRDSRQLGHPLHDTGSYLLAHCPDFVGVEMPLPSQPDACAPRSWALTNGREEKGMWGRKQEARRFRLAGAPRGDGGGDIGSDRPIMVMQTRTDVFK